MFTHYTIYIYTSLVQAVHTRQALTRALRIEHAAGDKFLSEEG